MKSIQSLESFSTGLSRLIKIDKLCESILDVVKLHDMDYVNEKQFRTDGFFTIQINGADNMKLCFVVSENYEFETNVNIVIFAICLICHDVDFEHCKNKIDPNDMFYNRSLCVLIDECDNIFKNKIDPEMQIILNRFKRESICVIE